MPLKPKVQPPSETSSETRPTCKIFISFRPLISLKVFLGGQYLNFLSYGESEILSHKNDLNSYCQRLNTPLPVYKTTFACTGSVGGKTFTSSSSTLTNRRSVEQDAAKLLHYNIYSMRIHLMLQTGQSHRDRGLSASPIFLKNLVCQEKTRCKMILNEFIDKIEVEFVYETVQVEMAHVFVSSLVLNGTCYKGECGKNKKEDEQLAALSAILSLLDDPIYGTQISEVLYSKFSACAVFKDCSVTSNEFKATTSNGDNFTISLRTTTGKIKFQEATKPASQQIGEFVPAPAAAHNPCNDSIFSRKRRRKNKEKANKRLRAENK
ncbi:hypothetical protein HID58_089675 [Brassica napus]|uniref:DRBM domain-containing protein n=1 Tax=Brassica napus TaxID=3708 RepID=A0ABQ7XZS1_BRANA|nr:hypothetical protein HID58_089675 [Brassica napus]